MGVDTTEGDDGWRPGAPGFPERREKMSIDLSLRGVIADAIRDYCHSVSPAAVQDSHGTERIYYAGIDLCGLADAIFSAIPHPAATPGPVETGTVHKLKTWPEYFTEVLSGRKPFEWRVDDRDFKLGDTLVLQEYVPHPENPGREGKYTGREITRTVSYIFSPWPTNKRTVVMGLAPPLAAAPCFDRTVDEHLWGRFVNHYWDSLEGNKEIVLLHVRAVLDYHAANPETSSKER